MPKKSPEIFSYSELEDIDEFFDLWIDYLGEQDSLNTQKLMKEAFLFVNEEKQKQCMRQYYLCHPALYDDYLEIHKDDIDKKHYFK